MGRFTICYSAFNIVIRKDESKMRYVHFSRRSKRFVEIYARGKSYQRLEISIFFFLQTSRIE